MRRFSLSWRVKLVGLFAGVLASSLLFQLFYVLPVIRNREAELVQAYQEYIARNIARELDADLMETYGRLQGIAKRPEFRNMDTAAQQSIMDTIAQGSYRVQSLSVINAGGWFVAGTAHDLSLLTTRSYADEAYFTTPFEQGDTYFAPARFYPSEQLVALSISVPIESEAGERVGVLMGGFRLNHLIATVADYPLEDGQVVCVIDKEGRVIADSRKDLFALKDGPLSLNYSNWPMVRAVMNGEKAGSQEYEHDGFSYLGSYVISDSDLWGVVVGVSMSSILARSEALVRPLVLFDILFFGVALLVTLILTRQITEAQRRAEKGYRALVDHSLQGLAIFQDGRLVFVNQAFGDMTGYTVDELLALSPEEVRALLHPDDRGLVWRRYEDRLAGRALRERYEFRGIRKDGTVRWAELDASLIEYQGRPAIQVAFLDITERKQAEARLEASLREKEVLLKEIHHRVKNNLQVISSLLNLEAQNIEDPQALEAFQESRKRLRAMALIHERLYQTENLAGVDAGAYLRSVVDYLVEAYAARPGAISVEVHVDEVSLNLDTAIPCGLIINELVSNALKHAFPAAEPADGQIRVELRCEGEKRLALVVSDNGGGLPPDFDIENPPSLGLQLVNMFTEQLGGTIELDTSDGTAFKITFAQPEA